MKKERLTGAKIVNIPVGTGLVLMEPVQMGIAWSNAHKIPTHLLNVFGNGEDPGRHTGNVLNAVCNMRHNPPQPYRMGLIS